MFESTAIFLPAKLSSKRLPRKHLLELKGKPVIQHLIKRVKNNTKIKKIILCTTENDEELEAIAEKCRIEWFRGRAGSVLKQYAEAVRKYDLKYVVNVDCDDLLVDFTLIDKTVLIMESMGDGVDYLTWEGYPLGCAPYGMSAFGIKWAHKKHKDEDIEYVWRCLAENEDLTKFNIHVNNKTLSNPYSKELRLTLDYIEDFRLFEVIYNNLYDKDNDIHFDTLMDFINKNPHLVKVNKHMNLAYREHQNKEA